MGDVLRPTRQTPDSLSENMSMQAAVAGCNGVRQVAGTDGIVHDMMGASTLLPNEHSALELPLPEINSASSASVGVQGAGRGMRGTTSLLRSMDDKNHVIHAPVLGKCQPLPIIDITSGGERVLSNNSLAKSTGKAVSLLWSSFVGKPGNEHHSAAHKGRWKLSCQMQP